MLSFGLLEHWIQQKLPVAMDSVYAHGGLQGGALR